MYDICDYTRYKQWCYGDPNYFEWAENSFGMPQSDLFFQIAEKNTYIPLHWSN